MATPPQGQQARQYGITIPGKPADRANLERVASIFVMAEFGFPVSQCDLFDDLIDRDASLHGLVEGRTSALSGKPTQVVPGTPAPSAEDQTAADAFAEVWARLDTDSLISWHQFSAPFYGWGATEIGWQWNPDDGRWDPADLWHVRSRQFRVATEVNRVVPGAEPQELLVQTGPTVNEVARLIPDKWIVSRRAPTLRISRAGLMHVCARYALLRTQGWAHWFAFLRRYGIPALKVKIGSWADAAQQAQAADIIRRWGEEVGFIVDKDADIEPEVIDGAATSRSSASDPQQRFTDAIYAEFRAIWTGIPIGSDAGGVGNYYTNRTLAGNRIDVVESDARRITTAIRRGLIEPWMRINGIPGAVPRVDIRIGDRIQDPTAAIDATVKLASAGYRVDLDQLQEITGLKITREDGAGSNSPEAGSSPIEEVDDED